MTAAQLPPQTVTALAEVAQFPLLDALYGRRSRRFALGAEIPDGPLAYRSAFEPMPLDDLERLLVLTSMGGATGWHYGITRNARYAPHFGNYAGAAGGRTFPSAAGFHTAELFFTDDSGTYLFATRDAGALVDPADEHVDPELMLARHAARIRRIDADRVFLPAREPYLEGHNTWCVNVPGSLLAVPVADLAQHMLLILCFLAQSGYCLYDDVLRRPVPGIEQFSGLVDPDNPYPLTFVEQYALTEATARAPAKSLPSRSSGLRSACACLQMTPPRLCHCPRAGVSRQPPPILDLWRTTLPGP